MSVHEIVYTFVSAFAALFPVMNPIGSGFIVNNYLSGLEDSERKTANKKIIVNSLLIAIGSLLAGHFILLLFGLAIPVIEVGGSIIICKTGLGWLADSTTTSTGKAEQTMSKINMDEIQNKLFYPIAFPMSVGPGTISVIFTLMAAASKKDSLLDTGINYFVIILAIVAICSIFFIFLSQGKRIVHKLGDSGSLIINKLIAFITFCIGIQIFFNGIAKIFHLNIL